MRKGEKGKRLAVKSVGWWIGALLQGLLLGGGLTLAVLKILEFGSGAQIFRYQGF